jgi:hypothetical protein
VVDLHATKGDTNVFDVDTNVDLTANQGVWFVITPNEWGDPFLLRKSLGTGITAIDLALGKVQVVLASGDLDLIATGRYFWACKIKESNARETTVAKGDLYVEANLVGTTP